MADVTTFITNDGVEGQWGGSQRMYVMHKRLDFSATNVVSTNTVQVFKQPAYTKCLSFAIQIATAEGGTATVDVGYTGGVADVLIDGANLNSAAGVIHDTASTSETINAAVIPIVEDTIDMLINNDLDAAIIDCFAVMIDYRIDSDRAASAS